MNTVREVLDVIDEFLARGDSRAGALWDVLTALRGPDDESKEQLKSSTTSHIRRAAFPLLASTSRTLSMSKRVQHFGLERRFRCR